MFIALALCLLMTAGCGGGGEIVGSDWRTRRGYVPAEVNHDGGRRLLLAVEAAGAGVYLDQESQVVYGRITFPYESSDLAVTTDSLKVEDRNGDGYDDLIFTLCRKSDGGETAEERVFVWDPAAKNFTDAGERGS